MDYPFQIFLCMLFAVVCVVFIVWMLRQSTDGYITTTDYQTLSSPSEQVVQAQTSQTLPSIEFTAMRLLVYYSRIAVVAASGGVKTTPETIDAVREQACDTVLVFCKVDGLGPMSDVRDAIPACVEYAINELNQPLF